MPDRIMRAMDMPIIDHRGPEFARLTRRVLDGIKTIFKTANPVIIYPSSGTGAWEASLVNALSPGDHVLMYETGQFGTLWKNMAAKLGLVPVFIESDWRTGAKADVIEAKLREDKEHKIKAVCVLHNETSTGVVTDIAAIRRAMDRADHPALLLVDVVSSLACTDFRFDEWRVDVALTGPQKGLMLPPGMAILAVSPRAREANLSAKCGRYFWDWAPVFERNARGEFPYTPAPALIFGLKESLAMLEEEGLPNVFARHARLAEACRRAVTAMGLRMLAKNIKESSNTLTAVCLPDGFDSDAYLAHAQKTLELPLGPGLGDVKGKIFRIGHLGSLNELELLGALAGVEMTLTSFGVAVPLGAGLAAAETYLLQTAPGGLGQGR